MSNFTTFVKLVKLGNLFVKLPDLSNVAKLVRSVQLVDLLSPSEKGTTQKGLKTFA